MYRALAAVQGHVAAVEDASGALSDFATSPPRVSPPQDLIVQKYFDYNAVRPLSPINALGQ